MKVHPVQLPAALCGTSAKRLRSLQKLNPYTYPQQPLGVVVVVAWLQITSSTAAGGPLLLKITTEDTQGIFDKKFMNLVVYMLKPRLHDHNFSAPVV